MVDTKNIKIRKLMDNDLSEIKKALNLHNNLYKDNRTAEHWLWEYKSNYPDLFVFTIIEDNDEIAGSQAMIPIYLNINGKKFLTGKSENSLIHPKFRGTSYFKDMYDFAMSLCSSKKMKCVWGYTSAVKVWQKKLGFYVQETMYDAILILNLRKTFLKISNSKDTTQKKFLNYFSSIIGYLYSIKRLFKTKRGNYLITKELKSNNDILILFEKLKLKYPNLIYIYQDKNYVDWRIYNNPLLKYETYFVYDGDILEGYCYTCKKDNFVYLTDFTFNSEEVGIFLLSYLLKQWEKDSAIVLFFGNIKNPLIKTVFDLLKKFGFIKKKTKDAIVIKNIDFEDESILYDVNNWYMNGLWTEGYKY